MRFPKLSTLGRAVGMRFGEDASRIREISAQLLSVEAETCPHCNLGSLRVLEDQPAWRRCDHCGAQLALAEIGRAYAVSGAQVSDLVEKERSYASTLIVSAEALIIVAAIWAAYMQSLTTLIGGISVGSLLFLNAIVARYRSWQLEKDRMFELKAPFGDYLKWETNNIFGSSI